VLPFASRTSRYRTPYRENQNMPKHTVRYSNKVPDISPNKTDYAFAVVKAREKLRSVSTSIVRGAVKNPLAYCVNVALREFIRSLWHYFPLARIRCGNFNEEKAGVRASRFHANEWGEIFPVCCTPNTDQLSERFTCNKTEITFLSASMA